MNSPPRFLLYSHDGMGLGHTQRNLTIAAAILAVDPRAAVMLATGTDDIRLLGVPPEVEVLKLPSLRKVANGHYEARRLDIAPQAMLSLRSELLAATVRSFTPDVLIADQHPLGAGGELRSALSELRDCGGQAVLGLRDILDSAETVRSEWGIEAFDEQIVANYRLVLVYGQQEVFDPLREYAFSPRLSEMVRFCGYVTKRRDTDRAAMPSIRLRQARPSVLATAGGGEDGYQFMDSFISAADTMPWRSIAVAGPYLPEAELRTLRARAEEAGVEFHLGIEGLPDMFGGVDALVCMGGYNTLIEAIASGTPTVCLPRTVPRTEQLIRARAFLRLGLIHLVEQQDISVDALRGEVTNALATSRRGPQERDASVLDLDGAANAAHHLYELVGERAPAAGLVKGGLGVQL